MDILILAGGENRRIKSLTNKQKAFLKINNRTIISRQIDQLKKINKKIYVSLKYDDKFTINNLKKYKKVKFFFLKEAKKLGTAGCLEILNNYNIKKDILVVYSDILFNIDLKKYIKFHIKKNSDLTLFAHPNNHPYDSDLIETDKTSKVIKFYPKPHKKKYIGNLCLSGIYIINKKLLRKIEKNKYQDFSKDFLPNVIKKRNKVYSYNSREYAKDLGTPQRFKSAINDFNSIKFKKGNINSKIPAIFLDKDGVINRDKYNFKYQNPLDLIDGCFQAIKKINKIGFLTVIVTNQPSVAKGLVTIEKLEQDFKKLETILGKNNCYVDKIYYCPCHPTKGFEGELKKYKRNCSWRKPNNGMLIKAIKDLNIDKNKSYMIGDTLNDLQAAKKTNIKFIQVGNKIKLKTNLKFKNLNSAINYIFKI